VTTTGRSIRRPAPGDADGWQAAAAELKANYEAGLSIEDLTVKTGLSPDVLLRILNEARTTYRLRGGQDELLSQQQLAVVLRTKYEAGLTIRYLAFQIDRSYGRTYRILSDAGTTFRPRRADRRPPGPTPTPDGNGQHEPRT
jgi:hypothetical protein